MKIHLVLLCRTQPSISVTFLKIKPWMNVGLETEFKRFFSERIRDLKQTRMTEMSTSW